MCIITKTNLVIVSFTITYCIQFHHSKFSLSRVIWFLNFRFTLDFISMQSQTFMKYILNSWFSNVKFQTVLSNIPFRAIQVWLSKILHVIVRCAWLAWGILGVHISSFFSNGLYHLIIVLSVDASFCKYAKNNIVL